MEIFLVVRIRKNNMTTRNTTEPKRITIVGGGLDGTSLAHKIATEYTDAIQSRRKPAAPLTIQVIDPAETIGPGLPYTRISDDEAINQVATNNQPNESMGTDHDDPDNYVRHRAALQDGDPSDTAIRHAFTSRVDVGDFAKTLAPNFNAQAQAQGLAIKIKHIRDRVSDIRLDTHENIAPTCILESGQTIEGGLTICSLGHEKSGSIPELVGTTGFFSFYGDKVEEMRDLLQGQDGDIVIRGTSQSMVDYLRLIEHFGFQGTIHAVSRNAYMPWEFNPADYPENISSIDFTAEATVQALKRGTSLEQTIAYLENKDVPKAAEIGVGKALVYKYALRDVLNLAANNNTPEIEGTLTYIKAMYGNPTPKASSDLIARLRSEGRMQIHKADFGVKNLPQTSSGFDVKGNTLDGLKIKAFFDGAIYARSAIDPRTNKALNPIYASLQRQGGIIDHGETPDVFKAGQQAHPLLYLANGPATNAYKWGIGTFREGNAKISNQVVENHL